MGWLFSPYCGGGFSEGIRVCEFSARGLFHGGGCKYDRSGWLAKKIVPEVGAEWYDPVTCPGTWMVVVPVVWEGFV